MTKNIPFKNVISSHCLTIEISRCMSTSSNKKEPRQGNMMAMADSSWHTFIDTRRVMFPMSDSGPIHTLLSLNACLDLLIWSNTLNCVGLKGPIIH